jgi:hypothetical protein
VTAAPQAILVDGRPVDAEWDAGRTLRFETGLFDTIDIVSE